MFGISRKARLILAGVWLVAGLLVLGQWLVDRPSIQIQWQTETEFDSAGFNLLRSQSESGPYAQLNERLIPASNDAAAGADYSFADDDVVAGRQYYYQLEDVDLAGNTTAHTPIAFVAPDRPVWLLATALVALLIGLFLLASARPQARNKGRS